MVICLIIIKHTISYEFITLTQTVIIGQLLTSSIDLYVKHTHLYNAIHRLNLWALRMSR